MSQTSTIQIPMITNDGRGPSFFDCYEIATSGTVDRMLSEQQAGHKAKFLGDEELRALHLKLEKRQG